LATHVAARFALKPCRMRALLSLRSRPALTLLALVTVFGLAGSTAATRALAVQGTPVSQEPRGAALTPEQFRALVGMFTDEVLIGGQVPPRISRWVNEEVFVFLQLDAANPAEATEVRYIGIGVKGVFCAETQPDPSFTHFHKYDAPEYGEGHGSAPGDQGYWLTWVAVTSFETRDGRQVEPGVDYEFSPTPPPGCGSDIPAVAFDPPGAEPLTKEEIAEFIEAFNGTLLTGGQVPPRFHLWVNESVTIFAQFDSPDPAEATELRNIGITVPGVFCAEDQPSEDFPHFHQTDAPTYGEGHGSAPNQVGYWLLWVATTSYEARDGRQVTPGVDRQFSPTPPPSCAGTPEAGGTPAAFAVSATEWAFAPHELRVAADQPVAITFTNDGTIPHTLTIGAIRADTGSVAAGATAELTFAAPPEPGRYEIICSFGGHPEAGMVGAFIVE
jgi:plastocyanin